MKKNNRPIGFLDSGIGGSTVLVKALKVLPIEATPQKRPLGALGTMFALERLVRRRTRRRVLDRIGQPPAIMPSSQL